VSFFRGHLLNGLGTAQSFRRKRNDGQQDGLSCTSAAAIAALKIEELSSVRIVGFPVREAPARIRKESAPLLRHKTILLMFSQGVFPRSDLPTPAIDLPRYRTYHRRQ
jgi:hypothetical protein